VEQKKKPLISFKNIKHRNFQSPQYKNKQMREAAYKQVVDVMDITGFGIPEVKNNMDNLRSTYA
jgi:hypothetical protein